MSTSLKIRNMICPTCKYFIVFSLQATVFWNLLNYVEIKERLYTIDFLPPNVRPYILLVIILAELFLSFGLLIGKNRAFWSNLTFFLLLFVATLIVYLIFNPWDPNCDYCKGVKAFAAEVRFQNIYCLLRN